MHVEDTKTNSQHENKNSTEKTSAVPDSLTAQQWEVIKRLQLQEYYPSKMLMVEALLKSSNCFS